MRRFRPVSPFAPALLLALSLPVATATEDRLQVGNVELTIRYDGELSMRDDGTHWREWLATILRAAKTVTGDYPRDRVRIDLESASRTSGAIAFGQVRRGATPRIRFYVNPDADLDSLNADWRGYHEFAHLLIPFPGNDDIWFTEGFASYYQYLLQARAGVVQPREAWQNLIDGFERGRRDPNGRGRSLRMLSPNMWRERAYRRVYWTGAAFFLRVDTRLRTASGGRQSLDQVLADFHECCLNQRRRWSARSLVETFGRLSDPEIWREEYQRTLDTPAAPDTGAALTALGIEVRRGRVHLDEATDKTLLRQSLLAAGGNDGENLATSIGR